MNLKGLFSSLLKTTEDKERRDKDLLREIMLFVNQIKKEYSLEGFVNVQLIDELPINQGISVFGNNICNVQIGIKECRKRNELLEREWITLKNTIIHELTHVKNRVELAQDTQKKIKNNIHSLTYFAVQLVDEYNAYKAADDRFKQFRIGCEESVLQRALQLFWLNEHFIQVTGLDDKSRYNHFYDNCTAIIVHSIRNEKFPSIPETYSGYNDMCKKIIEILEEYNSKMPLDYAEYEEAGKKLWNALLIMVPNNLKSNFKKNIGIRF